ncbi:PH domain-containing protein [Paenibacillus sp. HJL G12]|uniref:PH domain-containing protein n=1 Tax=Paenibacillus dendrobii TaxID=2691084 RepID=A0A7X3IPR3_9BACL|nr:PH domain-containing protein [Paenibacillus dendrobii]
MDQRMDLMRRCHPDSVKVSRMVGFIMGLIFIAVSTAYVVFAAWRHWTVLPGWIALALSILLLIWYTWVSPGIAYRMFGFRVSEEDLEIKSGWIWYKDIIVPMTRVQHVELERGPLLRKYNLAEVKVVTAATSHVIKALELREAESLKQRIGELAKVVEHDE